MGLALYSMYNFPRRLKPMQRLGIAKNWNMASESRTVRASSRSKELNGKR